MFHKPCPGYEDHFYSQLREDSDRVKKAQQAQGKALMSFNKPEGMTIEDREIDSVEGDHKVHIRIYTPAGLTGKSPVILDIHGGAWVGGNLEIDNQRCAQLAIRVPCVVVGVEYRLCTTPDVHFPMNLNDVYAAYTYCRDHAEEIGGNGMVGTHGSSSGANLAGGLALYLRDNNEPAPALTVLNCPPLNIDFNEDYSYHQNFELRMGPDAKAIGAENAHLGGYLKGLGGKMPSCYAFPYYAGDVGMLDAVFAPGEAERIYLNFPDPWPKSRDAKLRLTAPNFLRRYAQVLAAGGELQFKTDNTPLFDWSLDQFAAEGWTLREVTHDLHENGVTGILTGYEAKFIDQGLKINRLVAVREPETKTLADGEVPRLRDASLCDARGYDESKETHAKKEHRL